MNVPPLQKEWENQVEANLQPLWDQYCLTRYEIRKIRDTPHSSEVARHRARELNKIAREMWFASLDRELGPNPEIREYTGGVCLVEGFLFGDKTR